MTAAATAVCECHGEPLVRDGKINGRQRWRCRVKRAELNAAWAARNADRRADYVRARRKRHKAVLDGLKGSRCSSCGRRFQRRLLHFHHRDPSTKLFAIGQSYGRSLSSLLAEVEKCDVLCADCHEGEHERRRRERRP